MEQKAPVYHITYSNNKIVRIQKQTATIAKRNANTFRGSTPGYRFPVKKVMLGDEITWIHENHID